MAEDTSITAFDQKLLEQVDIEVSTAPGKLVRLPFQFPPAVPSDNKGGDWKEIPTRAAEPIPFYMGGQPRQLELKFTYIVTNEYWNGKVWDAGTISSIVKMLRGYFYNLAGSALIIKINRLYDIGGSRPMTWRADSISVSHSDIIVCSLSKNDTQPASSQGEDIYYPLRTDITMQLKFYTTMNGKQLDAAGVNETTAESSIVKVPGLAFSAGPEWY